MFCLLVASLRSLARIQPFCTNVSLPSGRTSLIVACRSTSGVEDLTQRWTAPPPTAVVSLVERRRDVGHGVARRAAVSSSIPTARRCPTGRPCRCCSSSRSAAARPRPRCRSRRLRRSVCRRARRSPRGTRCEPSCRGPGTSRTTLRTRGTGRRPFWRRAARCPRRCRTAPGPAAALRTPPAPLRRSAVPGSDRPAASRASVFGSPIASW